MSSMNPADFGSMPEFSNHLLQEDFSAIVHGAGFGELMTDLGICDHEHLSMFNPIFVDQSDDRSGFDGAVSQSAGFNDSRQTKRGQGNESAYAHALKSSARNLSSEDPAQAHDDGDEQNLSWSKSKRLCAASSERVASGTGGAGPGRAVMGYGDPDHARHASSGRGVRGGSSLPLQRLDEEDEEDDGMGRDDDDEGEGERDEAEAEDGTRSPVLSLLHLMHETRAGSAAATAGAAGAAGGWGASPPASLAGEGGHREWLPPQAGAPPPSGGQRRDKGLRSFSLKVCQKVEEKDLTTYNQVADELVQELQHDDASALQFDEKNIRRRVYDALNVLMAMDIIVKDKKNIKWKGFPVNFDKERSNLDSKVKHRRAEVAKKRRLVQEKATHLVGLKALIDRNRRAREEGGQRGLRQIEVPFVLVKSHPHHQVRCEIASDKKEVLINCSGEFELHDDVAVLERLNLAQVGTEEELARALGGRAELAAVVAACNPALVRAAAPDPAAAAATPGRAPPPPFATPPHSSGRAGGAGGA